MARVEGGRIFFSKKEFEAAKGSCNNCPLENVCGGLDSKINGADIHPNHVENPTDGEVAEKAECLK